MAEFRRRVPVPRRAAVVGVNGPFDLGVNPISHLVMHVDGVVAGATAVGKIVPYTDITNVRVALQDASIVNMSAADLQASVAAMLGHIPYILNHLSVTNGDLVRLSIVIPFGRKRFWPMECFPASKKGDLTFSATFGAEGATFQTRNFAIEAMELPGASPERFLKMVSLTRALTATDFDFPLPIANQYAGLLLFEPALADAGAATGTVRNFTLLLDHREEYVIASRFEASRDELEILVSQFDDFNNGALPVLGNFTYMNFDPHKDGEYLLDTSKYEDIRLRFELDNAGSPRVVPFELVAVPGAGAAA